MQQKFGIKKTPKNLYFQPFIWIFTDEDITDTTNLVNINDLEGNCVAVLQDNTANFRSQTSSEEEGEIEK